MPALEKDYRLGVKRLAQLAQATARLKAGSPADVPEAKASRLHAAAKTIVGSSGIHLEVSGAVPTSPCVIVSNHISWFDPLVVASLVPVTGIAKIEVSAWPVLGERAAGLGVIFVDRLTVWSGVQALFKARAALEAGVPVLNFPEGTTTHGDMLLPFRRAIFGLARVMDVPVVPMRLSVDRSLTWAGPDPLAPHLIRLCTTKKPVVQVTFGQPMRWAANVPDSQRAEEARGLMLRASSLKSMRALESAHATALSA